MPSGAGEVPDHNHCLVRGIREAASEETRVAVTHLDGLLEMCASADEFAGTNRVPRSIQRAAIADGTSENGRTHGPIPHTPY